MRPLTPGPELKFWDRVPDTYGWLEANYRDELYRSRTLAFDARARICNTLRPDIGWTESQQ